MFGQPTPHPSLVSGTAEVLDDFRNHFSGVEGVKGGNLEGGAERAPKPGQRVDPCQKSRKTHRRRGQTPIPHQKTRLPGCQQVGGFDGLEIGESAHLEQGDPDLRTGAHHHLFIILKPNRAFLFPYFEHGPTGSIAPEAQFPKHLGIEGVR